MKPVATSKKTPSAPCTSRCQAAQTGSSSGWELYSAIGMPRAALAAIWGRDTRPGRPLILYVAVPVAGFPRVRKEMYGWGSLCESRRIFNCKGRGGCAKKSPSQTRFPTHQNTLFRYHRKKCGNCRVASPSGSIGLLCQAVASVGTDLALQRFLIPAKKRLGKTVPKSHQQS